MIIVGLTRIKEKKMQIKKNEKNVYEIEDRILSRESGRCLPTKDGNENKEKIK